MSRGAAGTAACLAALVLTLGCGPSLHAPPPPRPVGEDLVALMPSGVDALFDVEVTQLGGWPTARRLVGLLPPEGRARLERLGPDPLAHVEALVAGVTRLGADDAEVTVVLRGDLSRERLRATLAADAVDADYRGQVVTEASDGALVELVPRVFALGSRVAVRRVIEVARREDESVRTAVADRALMTALGRAPTAKQGRPAIIGAIVPTAAWRERLHKESWPGGDLEWLTVALAVGDGFDVGVIAGATGAAEAVSLAKAAKAESAGWREQRTVRLLGLAPFVEPLIVVAKDAEVHFAYRLPGTRLDALVTRLEQIQALARRAAAAPAPAPAATPRTNQAK